MFPSLEYSFVPSMLFARQSTLVHIQWVGFDSNPNNGNNNGNGKAGTDRSNICQIRSADINSCICPTDECFQQVYKNIDFTVFWFVLSKITHTSIITGESWIAVQDSWWSNEIRICRSARIGLRFIRNAHATKRQRYECCWRRFTQLFATERSRCIFRWRFSAVGSAWYISLHVHSQ